MKQVSLSQQAYEQIRQMIVSLEMAPGSVINEAELRRQLDLGRTPIREALKRLSLEQLVDIVPRRGMFVSDIGIRDLQQLFEMRLVLESLAARLAADRGTEGHWLLMEAALTGYPDAADENERLIKIDEACHDIIYQAADNEFLRSTLITHYALSLRLWYYFLSGIGDMEEAVTEHKLILEALRVGNGEKSALIMERHIRSFQEKLRSVMLGSPLSQEVFNRQLPVS